MKSPVIFSKAMTFICKKFISLRPAVALLEPVAISQGLAVNVLTSGDGGNILQYMYEQRIKYSRKMFLADRCFDKRFCQIIGFLTEDHGRGVFRNQLNI